MLDPDRRQLVLDGVRVDLSPLEFGVLRCLHEAAAGVVRREDLLHDVWGADWQGASDALESVVSSTLRRRPLG